jgi:hypothetical protein
MTWEYFGNILGIFLQDFSLLYSQDYQADTSREAYGKWILPESVTGPSGSSDLSALEKFFQRGVHIRSSFNEEEMACVLKL